MTTAAARRSVLFDGATTVLSRRQLALLRVDAHAIDAQVAARRWQRVGPAVILHNAEPTVAERREVYRLNCGPRAVLTSFSAADEWGLEGWERDDEVHVLAPAGTARPPLRGLRLHRVGDWSAQQLVPARGLHRLAPALVIAASSFTRPRGGYGLLASGVQQRLVSVADLRAALECAPRTRHRRALLLAVADIEQGAEALGEIDFARLCRRHGLPEPDRQSIRPEPGGRRRYLDVEWTLPDGRTVVVEVDGAHHMLVVQWASDQLRQNEVVLRSRLVLRYPSVVVREEPEMVVDQLRRALSLPSNGRS